MKNILTRTVKTVIAGLPKALAVAVGGGAGAALIFLIAAKEVIGLVGLGVVVFLAISWAFGIEKQENEGEGV